MSRVDDLRSRLEAELAVAVFEDELVAAKESNADPETLRDLKLRLRDARQEWRSQREGAAAVVPVPVAASAAVEEKG